MKTSRADLIYIKVEQLKDKFKNYLCPLFEEWKRVVGTITSTRKSIATTIYDKQKKHNKSKLF